MFSLFPFLFLLSNRATSLDKKFTFYDPGLGACGATNGDDDFIVAMNVPEFNGGASCNKEITITYNGKTAKATVVDECMSCPVGGLDLSRGLFNFFADEAEGVILGDWSFGIKETTTATTTTQEHSTTTTTTILSLAPSLAQSTTSLTTTSTTTAPATSSDLKLSPSPSPDSRVATPMYSLQVTDQINASLLSLIGILQAATKLG
ncbi:RlpA-like double-psi beta-barrel-protein domain-containing protein-containing protein [Favolaschia claudopus]|uniref:RlpA-like double-psi beta-barrel-protein domain-containing protein-containing protein n=1 Tax=Favolaschia claudopus TaxID=2862362 RepID=A0AAW0EIL7_9AGAR